MIFNGNKFGKRDDSANNSRSPTRRGTGIGNPTTDISQKGKSPNATANKMNTDGVSMISANSSGKFSMRQVLGNESVRGEPLELMTCPSHENMPLDYYSINIREFMCRLCIREIEGT